MSGAERAHGGPRSLARVVIETALRVPDAIAIRERGGTMTYAALDAASDRAAAGLRALGVRSGDRVALWLEKSARAVAVMQGVLRLGAAYVPIGPESPTLRAIAIATDCDVRAIVSTAARARLLRAEGFQRPSLLAEEIVTGRSGDVELGWDEIEATLPPARDETSGDALAYILYTSGSTGRPKGVCISHENALAFIQWAAATVGVTQADRLSSHAPFHFDLSVFDLYAAFLAGATVCLVPEGTAYAPKQLVELLRAERITIWYSVPSALVLMAEHGDLVEAPELRVVIFAGEVFPIKQLRALVEKLPAARFFNWYGPTETNVCTSYEVGSIREDATTPVPIGRAASGDRVFLRTSSGGSAPEGLEGELMVDGPTVMLGYWGEPLSRRAPYGTGDIARVENGQYVFVGRHDSRVKVRGHRIELGDIEAKLLTHPDVEEAAVLVEGDGAAARLIAYLATRRRRKIPLLELKAHCAKHLPRSMLVDAVRCCEALPRTPNGKIDRLRLGATTALGPGDPGAR